MVVQLKLSIAALRRWRRSSVDAPTRRPSTATGRRPPASKATGATRSSTSSSSTASPTAISTTTTASCPARSACYQGGDWQGVIDHLDYLQTLGVTALWISPVVRNLETDANFDAYHGYWQQDFTHVNPHFGDLAKLRELVNKAHAARHQGDPRHRHQPHGAALLLRHQRQRPSRRERLRRRLRRAGARQTRSPARAAPSSRT